VSETANSAEHIGWLGTGRMGAALAGRLIDGGVQLSLWNRTMSKMDPLVARGGIAVGTISGLGSCDIVFISVSASTDLEDVTIGSGGLLTGDAKPRLIVDCSTVSAEASAAVRAAALDAGVGFLAAPVSGNPRVVAAGGACLVVSGPEQAYLDALPYLRLLAKTVVHAGEEEQSRLVKLCHNLYLGIMVEALVEVTTLAEKGGTRREAFLEFLNGTVVGSDWVRNRTDDLVARDWTPTFTMQLLCKDFDIGLGAAHALQVPMPIAASVHQLIQTAIGHGLSEQDLLSLYEPQARRAALGSREEREPVAPPANS